MNAEQIEIVLDTWKQLETRRDELGVLFYEKLFERDPSMRLYFKTDLGEQARKLGNTLSFAVTNLRRPDTLLPVVRQLGRMHAALGVGESHYALAALPLLEALRDLLRSEWNTEVESAWAAFYAMVAEEMAMATAAPQSP